MASGRTEVETTVPFHSVKEAIAIFGDRLPWADKRNTKARNSEITSSSSFFASPSSQFHRDKEEERGMIFTSLKKLESQLVEMKREVMVLKQRETETEVTVASLTAELHKSMSKIAEMEALGAARAAAEKSLDNDDIWQEEEEEEGIVELEYLPSLAQVLSIAEMKGDLGDREKKVAKKMKKNKKKKAVEFPLFGNMFLREKATHLHHDDAIREANISLRSL